MTRLRVFSGKRPRPSLESSAFEPFEVDVVGCSWCVIGKETALVMTLGLSRELLLLWWDLSEGFGLEE